MKTVALLCLLAFGCAAVAPELEAKTTHKRRAKHRRSRTRTSSMRRSSIPPAAGRTPYQSPNPAQPANTPPPPGGAAPPH